MGLPFNPHDGQIAEAGNGKLYQYTEISNAWFKVRPNPPVEVETISEEIMINLYSKYFDNGDTYNFKLSESIPCGKNGIPDNNCKIEVFVGNSLATNFIWGKTIALQKNGLVVQFAKRPQTNVKIAYSITKN